jgi:hypothetical protein
MAHTSSGNYIWHDLAYSAVRQGLNIILTIDWWGYFTNGTDASSGGIYFSGGYSRTLSLSCNGVSSTSQVKASDARWANFSDGHIPSGYDYDYSVTAPSGGGHYGLKHRRIVLTIPNVTGNTLTLHSEVSSSAGAPGSDSYSSKWAGVYSSDNTISVPDLVMPSRPGLSINASIGNKDGTYTLSAVNNGTGSGGFSQYHYEGRYGGTWQDLGWGGATAINVKPANLGAPHGGVVYYRVTIYNSLGYTSTSYEVAFTCASQPAAPVISYPKSKWAQADENINITCDYPIIGIYYQVNGGAWTYWFTTSTDRGALVRPNIWGISRGGTVKFRFYQVNSYGVWSAGYAESTAFTYLSVPSNPSGIVVPTTPHRTDTVAATWNASTQAQGEALSYRVKLYHNGVLKAENTTTNKTYSFILAPYEAATRDVFYITVQAFLTNYSSVVSGVAQSGNMTIKGGIARPKVTGTYREGKASYLKLSGAYVEAKSVYLKVAGTWRESL